MPQYKAFDYRKDALSNRTIKGLGTPEKPYLVDYMFCEVSQSTKKVTNADGTITYVPIAPNPNGVKNLTVQDCVTALTKPLPSTTDRIPFGVIVRKGENVLIQRCTFSGFRKEPKKGGYPNGDPVCIERGAINTMVRDCVLNDNGDGAVDTKGLNTLIERTSGARNHRNFRFWDGGSATDCTSIDPRNAHVWMSLASARGDVTITRMNFVGSVGKAHVKIDSGKAGRSVTLIDPMIDGVPVTDPKQLLIVQAGTGTKVAVAVIINPPAKIEAPDLVGDITLDQPLRDSNGDGVIDLGAANQRLFGAKRLKLLGQNRAGQYVYEKAA